MSRYRVRKAQFGAMRKSRFPLTWLKQHAGRWWIPYESFKTIVPASLSAERLSDELLKKLKQLYPLRGKVLDVKNGEISLNIGEMGGVKKGQRFSVSGGDIILEVTSIQQDRSLARRVKGKGYPIQIPW